MIFTWCTQKSLKNSTLFVSSTQAYTCQLDKAGLRNRGHVNMHVQSTIEVTFAGFGSITSRSSIKTAKTAKRRIKLTTPSNSPLNLVSETRARSSRWQIQIWRLAIFRNDTRWTVLQILACALPITLIVTMWRINTSLTNIIACRNRTACTSYAIRHHCHFKWSSDNKPFYPTAVPDIERVA